MAATPLQLLVTLTLLATTVRCQENCPIPETATIDNGIEFLSCLRRQLLDLERHLVDLKNSDVTAPLQAELTAELEDRKSSESKPEVVLDGLDEGWGVWGGAGGGADDVSGAGGLADLEDLFFGVGGRLPPCDGLPADQCLKLVKLFEKLNPSLGMSADSDVTDYYGRMRRSVSYNDVSKLKRAPLQAKKYQQLDPVLLRNIKTLLRWQLKNGGDSATFRSAPIFKGRWGRSVGHVANPADQSEGGFGPGAARMRARRSVSLKDWLAAHTNSLTPRQMKVLADYIAWKAKHPGVIRFDPRHG